MIKESVLEIKRLVSDLHCMGTYGMVELELTNIEKYVNELEGKVKNLTIPYVTQQRELLIGFYEWLEKQNCQSYIYDKPELIDEYLANL